MRRAIYKGVVIGFLLLGIAYFWNAQGEAYMDVLRHIPEILFEGYQPAAFDPEVQKKFITWAIAECVLAGALLPGGGSKKGDGDNE